jgi:hypothetical protein
VDLGQVNYTCADYGTADSSLLSIPPRAAFLGPAWYQQYVALFMIPAIAAVGAAYYWLRVRGKQQVLREHQPAEAALLARDQG